MAAYYYPYPKCHIKYLHPPSTTTTTEGILQGASSEFHAFFLNIATGSHSSVTMKICVENLVDISKSAASPYLPVNTSFHLQNFFKLCLCLQITSLKKLSKAVITWAVRASLWAGSRLIHVACTSSHIWTAFPGRVWLKTAPGKGWYFLEECSKAAALAIWMG